MRLRLWYTIYSVNQPSLRGYVMGCGDASAASDVLIGCDLKDPIKKIGGHDIAQYSLDSYHSTFATPHAPFVPPLYSTP